MKYLYRLNLNNKLVLYNNLDLNMKNRYNIQIILEIIMASTNPNNIIQYIKYYKICILYVEKLYYLNKLI